MNKINNDSLDQTSANVSPLNLSCPSSSNASSLSPGIYNSMGRNPFDISMSSFLANMSSIAASMHSLNGVGLLANSNNYLNTALQTPTLKSFPKILVNPSGIKQEPEDEEETEPAEVPTEPAIELTVSQSETTKKSGEKSPEQELGDAAGSNKPIILCGTCDKSLMDIPSFLEHCQEHGDENTPLKCAICGPNSKLLKSPYTLKKHQRYLHKMSKLKCPHCSKVFCPNYYNRHIKTAHVGIDKFDCSVCKKVLCTRKGYKAHMENHFPENVNHYKCPICSKSIRESYLSKHLRYHQLDESFMCEICGIVMHNRGNFVYHQETHKTGKNRHLCEICGKSYKTNRVLKKHYTIHTGANKVNCRICDATLSNVHSLKTHMKIHQDDRPHQCRFCGKGFKHPGHKTAHERIHTGERPYECKICPSAFYEAGNLRKHMKKVHSNGKMSNKKFKFESTETTNDVDMSAAQGLLLNKKFKFDSAKDEEEDSTTPDFCLPYDDLDHLSDLSRITEANQTEGLPQ